MRKKLVIGLSFVLFVYAFPMMGLAAPAFSDISSHWAKSSIEQAVTKGYVSGYKDGTFKPDDPVTVAQFITMMILSLTEKDDDGNVDWSEATLNHMPDWVQQQYVGQGFKFTQGSPWYSNYMDIAISLGIIDEHIYMDRYNELLTRESAASLINEVDAYLNGAIQVEYAKLAVISGKDLSETGNDYQAEAGESMLRGIMSGYSDGTWKPKRWVTRAEAISIIERLNDTSQRTPLKQDLFNVPYTMAGTYGYADMVYIFSNWEMKKVYEDIGELIDTYPGVVDKSAGSYSYFEDEENKEKYYQQLYYSNDVSESHYYDLTVDITGNTYEIRVSSVPDRYERAADTMKTLIEMIYTEDAAQVIKLIDDNMINVRSQKKVLIDQIIENRQVLIYSESNNVLLVGISGYADK